MKRASLLALSLSAAFCFSACEPRPLTAPPPPEPPRPSATAPAPKAPPIADLSSIPRLDFNRVAAELYLPLFWVADEDGDKTIDPNELAVLWGIGSDPSVAWTDRDVFTPTFYHSYQHMQRAFEEGLPTEGLSAEEKKRRALVVADLGQGRPSIVLNDFSGGSEEDRAIVKHVLAAAAVIERLHAKQNGVDAMAAEIPESDTASRMLFYRTQGPWCEAPKTEQDPECNALARKPAKISGLYPADLQKKDPKFCETLAKRKDEKALFNQFSVVVDKGGELVSVPYNVAFKDDMEAVSRELSAAAAAIKSPSEAAFKAYLEAASKAFLDNQWEPADEAWAKMSVDNSKWYLRIAPDEVYFEPCSRKAGFHVSFARINQDSIAWQKKLDPVKGEMEEALAKLAGKPYKARKVSFHLPDFIDIVLNAGDARSARGATIGQSLPNWGPVANEGRGRTVAMTNLYTDKDSEASFYEQVKAGFCAGSMQHVTFDPKMSVMSTVLHEAAHNLGPAHEYKVNGKTDDEIFGGPLASTMEELKAQTAALYFAEWLVGKGLIDRKTADMAHARDMIWAFGHISQGVYTAEGKPKPYSQLASIQVGSMLEAGAMTWNAEEVAANGTDKGCFELHMDKFPAAIDALAKTVLGVKGRGDKAGALKLRADLVDKDGTWKDLRAVIQERWLRAPKATFVYAVKL